MLPAFALLLALPACSGCNESAPAGGQPAATEVCALPAPVGEIGWGDANRDGVLDVADPVRTLRALMDAGPAFGCADAQDAGYRDGLVDLGDALSLLYHLFVGNSALPDGDPDCVDPAAIEEAPCGRFLLAVEGESSATAAQAGGSVELEATVRLYNPDLPVQAWSLGLSAEGCSLVGASEAGTASADVRLDAAGRRDEGWHRSDLVDGRVLSSTVVSWARDLALPAQEEPWTLLSVAVQANAPASGCAPCTLRLEDGLAGVGQPVALTLSVAGRSVPPPTAALVVEVCAP